jgi:hypothetical protein
VSEQYQYLFPNGTTATFPSLWPRIQPPGTEWFRAYGETVVYVIDDQLSEDRPLVTPDDWGGIEGALNVRLEYCRACQEGETDAQNGRWFDAAIRRIRELHECEDRLAAVVLDLYFPGDNNLRPREYTGFRFLERMWEEHLLGLPVIILTAADDTRERRSEIAERFSCVDYLEKRRGELARPLSDLLFEHAWLSVPALTAYSGPMRATAARLRKFAIHRVREVTRGNRGDTRELPKPLLIRGPSGAGKSWFACEACRWLQEVTPWWLLSPGQTSRGAPPLQRFSLSGTAQDVDAQSRLFGRGPVSSDPPNGPRDPQFGLVKVGEVQEAHGGLLLFEEVGNAPMRVQQMLLTLLDNGQADVCFPDNRVVPAAFGPFRFQPIFTAQPAHFNPDRMLPDMGGRLTTGHVLDIPPLSERTRDLLPLFWTMLLHNDRVRITGAVSIIDNYVSKSAQRWLEDRASRDGFTARTMHGLAIEVPVGWQVTERALAAAEFSPLTRGSGGTVDPSSTLVPPVVPNPLFRAAQQTTGLALVDQINSGDLNLSFPTGQDAEHLRGRLNDVRKAAALLIYHYLEAAMQHPQVVESRTNSRNERVGFLRVLVGVVLNVGGSNRPKKGPCDSLIGKLMWLGSDELFGPGLLESEIQRSEEIRVLLGGLTERIHGWTDSYRARPNE